MPDWFACHLHVAIMDHKGHPVPSSDWPNARAVRLAHSRMSQHSSAATHKIYAGFSPPVPQLSSDPVTPAQWERQLGGKIERTRLITSSSCLRRHRAGTITVRSCCVIT